MAVFFQLFLLVSFVPAAPLGVQDTDDMASDQIPWSQCDAAANTTKILFSTVVTVGNFDNFNLGE